MAKTRNPRNSKKTTQTTSVEPFNSDEGYIGNSAIDTSHQEDEDTADRYGSREETMRLFEQRVADANRRLQR